jgi:hypothetical protein
MPELVQTQRIDMSTEPIPVVITVHRAKSEIVRALALERNLQYEEVKVAGREDLARFIFPPMGDKESFELANAVPRDALAWNAIILKVS